MIKRFKRFVAAFLIVMNAGVVRAADDAFHLFEEEAMVIAASKHPQMARRAPSSVMVITSEDIELSGYRTLTEALASVPGFYGFTDRNYDYLWVRGFGRPGDYSSRILLLLDGHRLNDNIYGTMFLGNLLPVDMRAIERIEVISGPGSALHGDNAFFAVINVVTRRPEKNGARMGVSAGGFGERSAFADVSLRKGELGLYATGRASQSRGQNHLYPQFETNGGVAADADRDDAHGEYAALEWGKLNVRAGGSRRAKRVPTASYSTRFNDNGTHTVDWRQFIEGAGSVELPRDITVNARVYYDWYGYYGNYLYDGDDAPYVNRDDLASEWWGTEVRARWAGLGESNALTVGGEFERNVRASQLNYNQEPYNLNFADDTRTARQAIFIQQELKPAEPLAITAGLRYDRYQAFGYILNPRLAGVYVLDDAHFIKALYGSAFRTPNNYERFYYSDGWAASLELKPETVQTYELSYEYRLDAANSIRLGYFQNRVKNLISQVLNADGNLQFVNKEKLRTDAVEASGQWALGSWSGRLAYMLQATREVGGDRLSNSPSSVASTDVRYRWSSRASLGARVQAMSLRRTVHATTLPAAGVFDVDGRVQPWQRGPVFTAALRNAFDADYSQSAANEHVQDALRQDGRSAFLGIEYAFGR